MNQHQIEVIHNGTPVRYDFPANTWTFVTRGGRQVAKPSLRDALYAVDNQREPSKKKVFAPFVAIKWARYDEPQEVTVTSYDGENCVWVRYPHGGRGKELLSNMWVLNMEVRAAITEFKRLSDELDRLNKQRTDLPKVFKLAPLPTLPKEVGTNEGAC